MYVNTEIADKYQEFFNFMNQEHDLTLTISEMDEIVIEAQKLVKKLAIPLVGTHLFGVYSPDDNLLSVHISEEGAKGNKNAFEKNYKIDGYYVDYVILNN